MSVQFNKNGNLICSEIFESSCMNVSPQSSISYTPGTGNNSCMQFNIPDLVSGASYYLDITVEWSGGFDTSNTNGTFSLRCQGSTYNNGSWNWNQGNAMTSAVNNAFGGSFTSTVLGSASGSIRKIVKFTVGSEQTGLGLGARSNYSNGNGKLTYKNLMIIPEKYFVNQSISSAKMTKDDLMIADNFIEI